MQDIIIGDFKSGLKRQIPGIVISGILALFLKISLNYKANATLYSGTFISNAGGVDVLLDICIYNNKCDRCYILVHFTKKPFKCMAK